MWRVTLLYPGGQFQRDPLKLTPKKVRLLETVIVSPIKGWLGSFFMPYHINAFIAYDAFDYQLFSF